MIIPALEYRRFLQRPRTPAERKAKLASLVVKAKVTEEQIIASYERGDDILDPDIFPKEDIETFAKEERIEKDPMVLAFIERALPRAAWT